MHVGCCCLLTQADHGPARHIHIHTTDHRPPHHTTLQHGWDYDESYNEGGDSYGEASKKKGGNRALAGATYDDEEGYYGQDQAKGAWKGKGKDSGYGAAEAYYAEHTDEGYYGADKVRELLLVSRVCWCVVGLWRVR